MGRGKLRRPLLALTAILALLPVGAARAETARASNEGAAAAASDIAEFFSQVGDRIYKEDCIFELSEEQLEVQQALIEAYVRHGADHTLARQLAVKQIRNPEPSEECERIRNSTQPAAPPIVWAPPVIAKAPPAEPAPRQVPDVAEPKPSLAQKQVLPQWDCGSDVDFVVIRHKGYERKLTGGEICNPFEDVVYKVPDTVKTFRLGYTIKSGRLFIIADDPASATGKTIAWAISGRDVCRNNPDPDCLAARAVGPLPPGEYAFASESSQRVSWGPKTKRLVAAVYLRKLWFKERFTPAQTAAILARGNIAIHVRLKGEMSEACLGLEPKAWAYVSGLIKEGRATGLNVYIDEPYPQIAEAPPILKKSSFSLSALFR
jgi:hypothetical protein